MMSIRGALSIVCIVMLVAMVAGCGGKTVEATREEQFALAPGGVLEIDLPRGDIRVVGEYERDELAVSASIAARGAYAEVAERDALPLRILQEEQVVRVFVEEIDLEGGSLTVDLEIMVPREIDLHLRTERGEIRAWDVHGQMDLHTERGITVFRGWLRDGEHRLHSAHGRVEFWLHRGVCARILASTTDGKIEDSSLGVRGARRENDWDVTSHCFSAPQQSAGEEPPVTVTLEADPGNIYLLSWRSADD
jgi:hypothetical protein